MLGVTVAVNVLICPAVTDKLVLFNSTPVAATAAGSLYKNTRKVGSEAGSISAVTPVGRWFTSTLPLIFLSSNVFSVPIFVLIDVISQLIGRSTEGRIALFAPGLYEKYDFTVDGNSALS
ncbi:hypothetical protein D3C84_1002860 [compost metagenome]